MKQAIFSLGLLFASVFSVNAQNKTQSFEASNFEKVNIGGSYRVILEEGEKESVTMTGDAELIDRAEVKVENGTLKIGTKKGSWGWSRGNQDVEVRVVFKKITAIGSSGSSEISVKSIIRGEQLSLACSGSGDITATVDVVNLDIAISGSANISLSGKTSKQRIAISGSGDVDAIEMASSEADVAVSGSGNIKIAVSDMLKGTVTGSGDIRYKGQPRQSIKISGSGSVNSFN